MKDKTRRTLGIFVHIEGTSTYNDMTTAWVHAHIVHVKDPVSQDFSFSFNYEDRPYQDIVLKDLISTNHETQNVGELKAVGRDLSLYEVQTIAKTMSAIETKIRGFNAKFGRPLTFEQHVLRLAAAVDAKWIITNKKPEAASRTGYNYHVLEVSSDYQYVQSDINDWYNARKPKEVTA